MCLADPKPFFGPGNDPNFRNVRNPDPTKYLSALNKSLNLVPFSK